MTLHEIGQAVRARREALGLSQERLARLCGLSRATVNQLETGALADLGVSKLATVLDLVGLQLEAKSKATARDRLQMASRTASVSYKAALDPAELALALATGHLPQHLVAAVSTFIDEAPLPIVVGAVEEAARRRKVPPKRVWKHVVRWAQELHSPRRAWS